MRLKVLFFLLICTFFSILKGEESFLLMEGDTGEAILEFGPHLNQRMTPCSTFKIVLCLIGLDSGVLKNSESPVWNFQEEYVAYLDSWKMPQTPSSWIKNSCLWYSQLLAEQLGLETIQKYLRAFGYGNQDFSGGLTKAWLSSSLEISPREQVGFIQKLVRGELPITKEAAQFTRSFLFLDQLPEGWKLFGKTGLGNGERGQIGWCVGWIEKGQKCFVFAYSIQGDQIQADQRIPRVKQLIKLARECKSP